MSPNPLHPFPSTLHAHTCSRPFPHDRRAGAIPLITYVGFFFFPGYRHAALTVADGKNAATSQTAVEQQQQQLLQAGPASSLAAAAGGSASANTQQHHPAPPVVRVTLASLEECNVLLHNGLDFYGATFFPVEAASPVAPKKKALPPNRYLSYYHAYRDDKTHA